VIDKQPARIAGMFDAIAGAYDFLNHLLSAGLDRRWRRRAIEALGLTGRETVLDLCTGTADAGLAALAGTPGAARVIGVDFSGGMLRHGALKIRRRGVSGALWLVQGDAARLPVRSASVDAVTVAFGLRNVERLSETLAEIHRSLVGGGRLAALEFAMPQGGPVRAMYLWYFTRVLPVVGRAISRHGSAYSYLPASVGTFPAPSTVTDLLRSHGFTSIASVRLTGGIVYLYVGTKAPAEAFTAGPPGIRAATAVL